MARWMAGVSSVLPSPTAPYFDTSNTRISGALARIGRVIAAAAQRAPVFRSRRLEGRALLGVRITLFLIRNYFGRGSL